jgi:hypothetical protein
MSSFLLEDGVVEWDSKWKWLFTLAVSSLSIKLGSCDSCGLVILTDPFDEYVDGDKQGLAQARQSIID